MSHIGPSERAKRIAASIVVEALNDHGGRMATFDQIERDIAIEIERALGSGGCVYLIEQDASDTPHEG